MIIEDGEKRLILIDCYGFVFRAYYVLQNLTTSDGTPIGAIQGFINMMHKLLFSKIHSGSGKLIAAILDKGSRSSTFRHQIYPEYKQHRPPLPPEIISQFSVLREMLTAFGLPYIDEDGVEADDIIATYAHQGVQSGCPVTVVSGDKDFFQLLSQPGITIYDPVKNKLIDDAAVLAKLGVMPGQVVDYLALIGDNADNVPGIKGIGPVSAAKLLQRYSCLEELYKAPLVGVTPKIAQLIREGKDMAFLSRSLVQLKHDIPLKYSLDELNWDGLYAHHNSINNFLIKYELHGAQRKIMQFVNSGNPTTALRPSNRGASSKLPHIELKQLVQAAEWEGTVIICPLKTLPTALNLPLAPVAPNSPPSDEGHGKGASLALDDWNMAEKDGETAYLVLATETNSVILATAELPEAQVIGLLRELIESQSIHKIVVNSTLIIRLLGKYDINLSHAYDDLLVMDYTLGTGRAQDFNSLVKRYGVDPKQLGAHVSVAALRSVICNCYQEMIELLRSTQRLSLYELVDKRLTKLLRIMESTGIKVDKLYLEQLSEHFSVRLEEVAEQLFKEAGRTFNIASPKQVEEVLQVQVHPTTIKAIFGKDRIPDTTADTMEKLAAYDITLAQHIISWRQLAKLLNTYVKGILGSIDSSTGRVHCRFHSIRTLTGRLAASDPNLQSIPAHTEDGVAIRKAFVAKEGHLLLSADYSQIELRLLAEIADIPVMREALQRGDDIHSITASQVFDIPLKDVDKHWRHKAKAINFGIIYGISAYGLARNLNTNREIAQSYINRYLDTYPGIREYMANTIKAARTDGYVTTLMGRRCYIPTINNSNYALRHNAERTAINAVIQGSAADLIRTAMVNLPENLCSMLVLQVHDELVFEVPILQREILQQEVVKAMMRAAPPQVTVPLKVDVRAHTTWE